eukprot:TRINITY_DN2818_c0_g1_i2.p1 TRINITY_DN2818_c0_g1~~TRINITY_DN2818_c0_g1_i2.p1  ORF type:complete len:128 (+),score=22.54 TRINITY_DN2818_c0_g1_i2:276-659(+)
MKELFTEAVNAIQESLADDDEPLTKKRPVASLTAKPKTEPKKPKTEAGAGGLTRDDEGALSTWLAPSVKLKVYKFKKSVLIDVRKYWTGNDGELKPTSKGISMTEDQWRGLIAHTDDIEKALAQFNK